MTTKKVSKQLLQIIEKKIAENVPLKEISTTLLVSSATVKRLA